MQSCKSEFLLLSLLVCSSSSSQNGVILTGERENDGTKLESRSVSEFCWKHHHRASLVLDLGTDPMVPQLAWIQASCLCRRYTKYQRFILKEVQLSTHTRPSSRCTEEQKHLERLRRSQTRPLAFNSMTKSRKGSCEHKSPHTPLGIFSTFIK